MLWLTMVHWDAQATGEPKMCPHHGGSPKRGMAGDSWVPYLLSVPLMRSETCSR